MNHKNNRRSVSTKNRIRLSLTTLLKEHELNRITVRALCEHAGINRSTFYNHYSSPEEILNELKADFLRSITSLLDASKELYHSETKQADIEKIMTTILEYIEENKELCLLLKNSDLSPTIGSLVINDPSVQEHFYRALSNTYPEEDMPYIYQYILHGGFRMIDLWILEGCTRTAQDMAKLFAALLMRF